LVLDLILEAPFVYLGLSYSLLEVAFITDEYDHGLVGLHLAEIVPLLFDIFEGALAGEVEDHQYAVAALEVG
jgi:hypothetical protein